MNKVILMGRLTRDPEVRYSNSQDGNQMAIARYTLAVDRRFAARNGGDNQQTADFINCVAVGRQGEFAEKYLKQGTKIAICGRIQTGSYTNKEGQKVFTTEVVIEEQEFAESKGAAGGTAGGNTGAQASAPTSAPEAPADIPPAAPEEGYIDPVDITNDLPFK